MSELKTNLESFKKELETLESQNKHLENEVELQADKAKKIAVLNEELRDLIT